MTKIKEPKFDKILWLDLEMTGLSPTEDLILEVAAIVTDWDFKEIGTYEGIVKNNQSMMKKRMKNNGVFWDAFPANRDAMFSQNGKGKSLAKIENELVGFTNKHIKKSELVLIAGNTIHMDRRFIIENWPKLDGKLYYRMLDVSAWKVVFENKFKHKFAKPDAHRALDDIRGSIIELQYYLKSIKI